MQIGGDRTLKQSVPVNVVSSLSKGRVIELRYQIGTTVSGLDLSELAGESQWDLRRCEDVNNVVRLCQGEGPVVVIIDLTGISAADETNLRKKIRHLNTVLLVGFSDSVDNASAEALLHRGYVGLLRRDESRTTIARAVEAVASGQLWFPRQILSALLRGFLIAQDPNHLTPRELEILELIGAGLNNRQIAEKLFISRETVRWYVKGLNVKLGIENRRNGREYVRSLYRAGRSIPPPQQHSDGSPQKLAG